MRFELPERLDHEFRAEHSEQLAACLAIAVLAGERATVGSDREIGSLGHEGAEAWRCHRRHEIEVNAAVYATVTEVAVQRPS